MRPNRLRWIGPASAPPCGQGLVGTPGLSAAGCANACRLRRWRFLPITSRRTVHGQPTRHRYGASTPRLKTGAARCGGGVLAYRRGIDLARVRGRAGAAFGRGCRAGPVSFRMGVVRPKASLCCCESWQGRGCASGFMAATVRRKQFPLLCHCVRRIPRGTNSFRLPALHCVAAASGAASPPPAGRITTRTRWARTLFHRKEKSAWPTSAPSPQTKTASPARFAP